MFDETAATLDLACPPSPVSGQHDGICLDAVVVAGVENLSRRAVAPAHEGR